MTFLPDVDVKSVGPEKKSGKAIFQTEQLSTFCASQMQRWNEVLNTKTYYKRDYKNNDNLMPL